MTDFPPKVDSLTSDILRHKTADPVRLAIRKMTWPELVKERNTYDDICYGPNACFGVRDMVYLDMLNEEIFRREETSD